MFHLFRDVSIDIQRKGGGDVSKVPLHSTKENHELREYLLEHAGGAVLVWAAEGARNYARNGFKLDIPEVVAEATEEYQARENWVANFIARPMAATKKGDTHPANVL